MHAVPDVLFHFSEQSSISRFEPHRAATAAAEEPLVWAIDADHADLYYFPRDCPRVTFHPAPETTAADRDRFLHHTTAKRAAAIESAWLPAMRRTRIYRYVLPVDPFEVRDPNAGYWVSREALVPISVQPVGDLFEALAAAGTELRVTPSLWPLYED